MSRRTRLLGYAKMYMVGFPSAKGILAFVVLLVGCVILAHKIIQCEYIRKECGEYRQESIEQCKGFYTTHLTGAEIPFDCECRHDVSECYSAHAGECKSCETVAAAWVQTLEYSGARLLALSAALACVAALTRLAWGEVVRGKSPIKCLGTLAVVDAAMLVGIGIVFRSKVALAEVARDSCNGAPSAMLPAARLGHAASTIEQLCETQAMSTAAAVVLFAALAVELLNVGYGFAAVLKPPHVHVMFEEHAENGATAIGAVQEVELSVE